MPSRTTDENYEYVATAFNLLDKFLHKCPRGACVGLQWLKQAFLGRLDQAFFAFRKEGQEVLVVLVGGTFSSCWEDV